VNEKAADADVRILEIRRERSERALKYAESNTALMAVHATFEGVVVIKSVFKGNGMSEVQEGDEVRPGLPILDIVDPTAMRVRARVNQADIELVELGRPAKVRLDAYPELSFDGRVDLVAPLGVTSSLTSTVRTFTALVSIQGMHPRLMPDLTASVELAGRRVITATLSAGASDMGWLPPSHAGPARLLPGSVTLVLPRRRHRHTWRAPSPPTAEVGRATTSTSLKSVARSAHGNPRRRRADAGRRAPDPQARAERHGGEGW
jgi:hypothetical protein